MDVEIEAAVRSWVLAQFPKVCGCKRVYTSEAWNQLAPKGDTGDDVESYDWRDCACGNTMGVVTQVHDAAEKWTEMRAEGIL